MTTIKNTIYAIALEYNKKKRIKIKKKCRTGHEKSCITCFFKLKWLSRISSPLCSCTLFAAVALHDKCRAAAALIRLNFIIKMLYYAHK